jgi:hypothetical protein
MRKEKGHQGTNSAALRAARAQSTQRPRPSADSSNMTGQATAAAAGSSGAAAAALAAAGRSQSAPGKRPGEQGSSSSAAGAQQQQQQQQQYNGSSTAVNGSVLHKPGHMHHHRHSIGPVATTASPTAGADASPWGEGSQGIAAAAEHDRKTLVGGGWDLGPGTRISVEQLFGPGAGVWGGGTATSPVDAAADSSSSAAGGPTAFPAAADASAVSSAVGTVQAAAAAAAAAVRAPVAAVGADAVTLTLLSNANSQQPTRSSAVAAAADNAGSHDCGLFGQFVFDVDDIMAAMAL